MEAVSVARILLMVSCLCFVLLGGGECKAKGIKKPDAAKQSSHRTNTALGQNSAQEPRAGERNANELSAGYKWGKRRNWGVKNTAVKREGIGLLPVFRDETEYIPAQGINDVDYWEYKGYNYKNPGDVEWANENVSSEEEEGNGKHGIDYEHWSSEKAVERRADRQKAGGIPKSLFIFGKRTQEDVYPNKRQNKPWWLGKRRPMQYFGRKRSARNGM